jgi:hypothetical protein
LPSLISLAKSLEPRGLSLVLVDVGEDRATVEHAVRQRGYDVPVLLDEAGESMRVFGIRATPTVVFLGRQGAMLGTAIGPRAWTAPGGRSLLEALLACKGGS